MKHCRVTLILLVVLLLELSATASSGTPSRSTTPSASVSLSDTPSGTISPSGSVSPSATPTGSQTATTSSSESTSVSISDSISAPSVSTSPPRSISISGSSILSHTNGTTTHTHSSTLSATSSVSGLFGSRSFSTSSTTSWEASQSSSLTDSHQATASSPITGSLTANISYQPPPTDSHVPTTTVSRIGKSASESTTFSLSKELSISSSGSGPSMSRDLTGSSSDALVTPTRATLTLSITVSRWRLLSESGSSDYTSTGTYSLTPSAPTASIPPFTNSQYSSRTKARTVSNDSPSVAWTNTPSGSVVASSTVSVSLTDTTVASSSHTVSVSPSEPRTTSKSATMTLSNSSTLVATSSPSGAKDAHGRWRRVTRSRTNSLLPQPTTSAIATASVTNSLSFVRRSESETIKASNSFDYVAFHMMMFPPKAAAYFGDDSQCFPQILKALLPSVGYFLLCCAVLLVKSRGCSRDPSHDLKDEPPRVLRTLVAHHAYLGCLLPCHYRCSVTHSSELMSHMSISAAVFSIVTFAVRRSDSEALVFIGALAVAVATAARWWTSQWGWRGGAVPLPPPSPSPSPDRHGDYYSPEERRTSKSPASRVDEVMSFVIDMSEYDTPPTPPTPPPEVYDDTVFEQYIAAAGRTRGKQKKKRRTRRRHKAAKPPKGLTLDMIETLGDFEFDVAEANDFYQQRRVASVMHRFASDSEEESADSLRHPNAPQRATQSPMKANVNKPLRPPLQVDIGALVESASSNDSDGDLRVDKVRSQVPHEADINFLRQPHDEADDDFLRDLDVDGILRHDFDFYISDGGEDQEHPTSKRTGGTAHVSGSASRQPAPEKGPPWRSKKRKPSVDWYWLSIALHCSVFVVCTAITAGFASGITLAGHDDICHQLPLVLSVLYIIFDAVIGASLFVVLKGWHLGIYKCPCRVVVAENEIPDEDGGEGEDQPTSVENWLRLHPRY